MVSGRTRALGLKEVDWAMEEGEIARKEKMKKRNKGNVGSNAILKQGKIVDW